LRLSPALWASTCTAWPILRPSGISSTGAKVRSQSTGQLLRAYCLSVRQQRCNSIKLLKPRHDRRTGPKPNPGRLSAFLQDVALYKELDQPYSTIDVNRLTGDPLVPSSRAWEGWESRRDSQRAWEGWEAGIMALHAFHTLSFPWSAFRPAMPGERVRQPATKHLS
jgi:hypothetical protein